MLHAVSNLPPRPAIMSAAYNEISGYMAARGDFSTEHDNHAELIVKDIDFTKEAEGDLHDILYDKTGRARLK